MGDIWEESGTSDRAEHFFLEGVALSVAYVWRMQNGDWAWQLLQAENGPWQREPSNFLAQGAAMHALQAACGKER